MECEESFLTHIVPSLLEWKINALALATDLISCKTLKVLQVNYSAVRFLLMKLILLQKFRV